MAVIKQDALQALKGDAFEAPDPSITEGHGDAADESSYFPGDTVGDETTDRANAETQDRTAKESAADRSKPQARPQEPDPVVNTVLGEYGVADPDSAAREWMQTMSARVEQLEMELLSSQELRNHPMANLSQDDVNEQVTELREKGKHVEADKILNDWRDYKEMSNKGAQSFIGERAKQEIIRYIQQGGGREKLGTMLQDEATVAQLKRYTGLIRADLPGGAEVLHLVILGMKAGEIAAAAARSARESFQKRPPAGKSTSAIHAPRTENARRSNGRFISGRERIDHIMR